MAEPFILTNVGLAKLASATPEDQLEISSIAVGDGNGGYTPLDPSMTSLVNEVWRGTASAPIRDPDNDTVLIFETIIPANEGGFFIREMGLFDADGDMIAICQTGVVEKPTSGSGTAITMTVRFRLALANAAQTNLIINDAPYIDHQALTNRSANNAHPISAITGLQGALDGKLAIAQNLADLANVATARSNLGLGTAAVANIATTTQAQALTDDTTIITPLKLLESGAVFPGEIRAFAGPLAKIPTGWLPCDGSAVSRTTYARLFDAIGTTYGSGNGSTTFNLPDLRGEFIRGLDSGRGVDPGRTLGSLQLDQMQRLTGAISAATTSGAPLLSGGSGAFSANTSTSGSGIPTAGSGATRYVTVQFDTANSPDARVSSTTSGETRPRNVALNYIIKY